MNWNENDDIGELYNQASGYYYAWVGQNASTGTPHPLTGKMSMYGRYYSFYHRKNRDKFVQEFYSNNPSEYAVKCNVQTGRKYSLGCSRRAYIEDLLYCPTLDDKKGNPVNHAGDPIDSYY